MKAKIKKAHPADINILNKISFESKSYWNYPEDWLNNWKDDLSLTTNDFSHQQLYKLINDDQIIGFCAIKETREHYEITHLWLKPDFIGKGLGKFLLNECIKRVVHDDKKIIVESDPNSEAFYQS